MRFVAMTSTCAYDFNDFMKNLIQDHDEMTGSSDFGDDDDLEEWGKTFERIQQLCGLASLSYKPKEVSLTRLLALSRNSQQSDPRDKVYGMLGLMNERLSKKLKPNHALSKADI